MSARREKSEGQIDTYMRRLKVLGIVSLNSNRNGEESFQDVYNSGEYNLDELCKLSDRDTL